MLPQPKVVVSALCTNHSTAADTVVVRRIEIVNILKDIEGIKKRLLRELKQTD